MIRIYSRWVDVPKWVFCVEGDARVVFGAFLTLIWRWRGTVYVLPIIGFCGLVIVINGGGAAALHGSPTRLLPYAVSNRQTIVRLYAPT